MLQDLSFVDEETLTNAIESAIQSAQDTLERDLPEVFTGDSKIKALVRINLAPVTGAKDKAIYRFEGVIAITKDTSE